MLRPPAPRYARGAWGAFMRAAQSISTTGTFDAFADAAPFATFAEIFAARRS